MKLFQSLVASLALSQSHASVIGNGKPSDIFTSSTLTQRDTLQNIVTFDEHSLLINGERLMIFSGEFHPFRLPVPSLWIDIFQKVKALGLNTVSFYVDWALLEGKAGDLSAEGIFALEPFFDAATKAGIYLNARPGPYINAEVSGGGYPGWLQRLEGKLRTPAEDYLNATNNYVAKVGALIAKAQITNGGPVILVQPENEYTYPVSGIVFPDGGYMQYVEKQLRDAGIVVPFMSNDAAARGDNAPGTGIGAVDIYGHDAYPLGFDCANPYQWPDGDLPTAFRATHLAQSPTTPYSIPEFQGGSFDPPGGPGFENCATLINEEFERVFLKNNYAAGITIMSLYMIYGGTNWGNLGHPGGYTSYDYAASIREDRRVDREKYSELKLQAQFFKVSPGYLVANASTNATTGIYNTNAAVVTTPILGPEGNFFVVRHANYSSLAKTAYTLTLPTPTGNFTIPQLGGSLTLNGRDSKVHVTDYSVGGFPLLYLTAEIFTWQVTENKTVLVVYGGIGELHELAFRTRDDAEVVEGDGVKFDHGNDFVYTWQWNTTSQRKVVKFGEFFTVYLLDRNTAYKYWKPDLPGRGSVIVAGPYLVRTAAVTGTCLEIQADFNVTSTPIEIIGAPSAVTSVKINGEALTVKPGTAGSWIGSFSFDAAVPAIPDLSKLSWAYIDSLPEILPSYDDSLWVAADHTNTTNPKGLPLNTTRSLYASDYGFHTGSLLYRGHFTAASDADDASFSVTTQGGQAYGTSAWLDSTFIGSWPGTSPTASYTNLYNLPSLKSGSSHVITVLIDNMGLEENFNVGGDMMKTPRGILNYTLTPAADISWKLTGNLGGEDYNDRVRGPLNEGGLFIERQGYHQPAPPLADKFTPGSPYEGITKAGVAYYTTNFTLALPSSQYDIPLSFVFTNKTTAAVTNPYRALLYVNGYQFGRYTSNIGPQTKFPVPEGILNYNGVNWIGVTIWALSDRGGRLEGLRLVADADPIWTGREAVVGVDMPVWVERDGAY